MFRRAGVCLSFTRRAWAESRGRTRGNSRADLGVPEQPDANDVDVQASRPYHEPLFPPHPSTSDRKGSQHEASNTGKRFAGRNAPTDP